MPKKVAEIESLPEEKAIFLRGKILEFLRKNHTLAYTLKEIFHHFLELDNRSEQKYQKNQSVLYHLIYGYLREFRLKKQIIHKGNYYYLNKEVFSKHAKK